jgi:NitT/TauT family transport system ATP-binding protein
MIELVGVSKTYTPDRGEPVAALESIDLTIASGDFLTVVGPSGCGKSTLLKLLAGLQKPTAGSIVLNGTPVLGPRSDIGIVFQSALLLPWRTVLQNALLAAELLGSPRAEATTRARQLLDMVGLAGFEDRYPFELSGGMQQRVSITRALLADPTLLLMDEPFGALDALTREQMGAEIERIWMRSRKTVFFITHSIPEAVFLGDRVVVMSARPGRIEDIVDVDLPRPRGLDLMGSPEFGALTTRLRHLLNVQGAVS